MIFVLDNYDSFTYNLVQRFGEIDPQLDIQVVRNNQTSIEAIEQSSPEKIIISPGPCTPQEAGLSKEVVESFAGKVPILGVCLGHQCIAEVFGAKVIRANRLMHGKVSQVHHDSQGVFQNLPNPFQATRYHSLIVPEESIPDELEICAWVEEEGHPKEIMGIRHQTKAVHGVQFHPESFLTLEGITLLKNFLQLPAEQLTGV
ncbi:aminodeoxychorismate/anthranilate synthase component II [uncultured Gimesia sp.]|uniref:anthranilate synthase component II n=1 Tax=uncultured Gimesia sp. TaxID=1678688 RepID=UPI00261E521B|nr:aminodeoxychorismate/anthranilate synthase component II [uncultured Gimesia sp.]